MSRPGNSGVGDLPHPPVLPGRGELLAKLVEAYLDVPIDRTKLRLLIVNKWERLSLLAHAAHEEFKGQE